VSYEVAFEHSMEYLSLLIMLVLDNVWYDPFSDPFNFLYTGFTRSRLKNGRKKSKNCVHSMPQMRKPMVFCKMLDMYFSSVVMISQGSWLIPNINQVKSILRLENARIY
jgi:hypothetical protein